MSMLTLGQEGGGEDAPTRLERPQAGRQGGLRRRARQDREDRQRPRNRRLVGAIFFLSMETRKAFIFGLSNRTVDSFRPRRQIEIKV